MRFITNDRLKYSFYALSIFFYLVFVRYANGVRKINDIIIEKRRDCLRKKCNIEGLVLGGSNALFGISSSQLTEKSNHVFINLSLYVEGGNAKNYLDYVANTTERLDRKKIKWIIYSTIDFYASKIEPREVGINGEKRAIVNYLIPNISLFSSLLRKFDMTVGEPVIYIDQYGDKEFGQPEKWGFLRDSLNTPNRRDLLRQIKWLNLTYRKLFPNAKLIFLSPPILTHNLSPFQKYTNSIHRDLKKFSIPTLIQHCSRYDTSMWVDNRHVNEYGRLWRTSDLLDSLNKQGWFD